jgi:hypothetical protein
MNLHIPQEYGGMGADLVTCTIATEVKKYNNNAFQCQSLTAHTNQYKKK